MPDATVTSERRREQRKRPLGLVYVELSSTNGGMLRDLSEQGFAMRAMMPLRPGDSTPFVFSLDPETRLEGQCKVLWVEEGGRVAGLEFTAATPKLRHTVREWLAENSYVAPMTNPASKPAAHEVSTLQELRDELRSVTPNLHAAEVAENKADQAGTESWPRKELRPIPVQTRIGELPVEPIDAAESPQTPVPAPSPEPNPEVAPLPPLESLPLFSEMEAVPEETILNRRLARSGISLAIQMMIFLALLACVVVFHRPFGNALIWLGQKIAGSDAPAISYAPKPDEPPAQATTPATPAKEEIDSATSGSETADKAPSSVPLKKSVEVPPVTQNTTQQQAKILPASPTAPAPFPATNRSTTFSPPSAAAASDLPGQQEYLAAQEILRDKSSAAGVSEAVRLLWVAVEKGNSSAEVTLAELYHTGRGVAKSCDQTRILLTAAAKKGNSDAQKHLDQFVKEGCE